MNCLASQCPTYTRVRSCTSAGPSLEPPSMWSLPFPCSGQAVRGLLIPSFLLLPESLHHHGVSLSFAVNLLASTAISPGPHRTLES